MYLEQWREEVCIQATSEAQEEACVGLRWTQGQSCISNSASQQSPNNIERSQFDYFRAAEIQAHTNSHGSTYRRRDSPTPHARDLEAPLLHLFVGQLDVEVELIVAGADDDLAAFLGEVGDTRVKLDIAIIFESLT